MEASIAALSEAADRRPAVAVADLQTEAERRRAALQFTQRPSAAGLDCFGVLGVALDERPNEFLTARHECDIYICTQLHASTTFSNQNVKCDVYIRKELRATVALSGGYNIGVMNESSFKGWVIELLLLYCVVHV